MPDVLEHLRSTLADRYAIQREIGRGGMATVYLAEDLKHHRQVAVKVLHPELGRVVGADRFLREIDIAAHLVHPHIVTLLDSGEAEGLLFYVMPWIEGASLRERLEAKTKLPIGETLQIGQDVASALAYAHRRGVVHRDVKPGNVMFSEGQAVVTDFGVAKAIGGTAGPSITGTGLVIGSPAYMSPEQAAGEDVDGRSDVYSLGCLLFECLSGRPPFTGPSVQAVLARHMTEEPADVRELRPDTPAALAEAIERALRKSPETRFASAAEMESLLRRLPPPPARGVTGAIGARLRRPSRWLGALWSTRWVRVALLALGLGLIGTLGVAIRQSALDPGEGVSGEPGGPKSALATWLLPGLRALGGDAEESRQAGELSLHLESVMRGLDRVALVGSAELRSGLQRLGLEPGDRLSAEEAASLSTMFGGHFVAYGTLIDRGDSVTVVLDTYDGEASRSLPPTQLSWPAADLAGLACELAARLLSGLEAAAGGERCAYLGLAAPAALQEYVRGLQQLYEWRFATSRTHLEAAVRADSSFSLPYYYLALALEWEEESNPFRTPRFGDSTRALASRAARLAEDQSDLLGQNDFLRLRAYDALLREEYGTARALLGTVLELAPRDFEALFLLGTVEFRDRGLEVGEDGAPKPRHNPNEAVRAYRTAVETRPGFHLGYGELFRLYREVIDFSLNGWCWGYGSASSPRAFCPIWRDSIMLLGRDDPAREKISRQELVAGADSVVGSAAHLLERWAGSDPSVARPYEELARLLVVVRRNLPGLPADRLAGLADSALHTFQQAVRLADHVPPEATIRLANLHLAAGEVDSALILADRGVRALDSLGVPSVVPLAANPYVATGQPGRALQVLAAYGTDLEFSVRTPGGARVSFGGAEPILDRIAVLGATGADDERLRAAFDELWSVWSPSAYGNDALAALASSGETIVRLAPALFGSQIHLAVWLSRLDSIPSPWHLVRRSESDPPPSDSALDEAIEVVLQEPEQAAAHLPYILGRVAQQLGRDSLALSMFELLHRWPAYVDRLDGSWGLRSLAYFHAARSLEAVGRPEEASRHYARFIDLWGRAETEVRGPLLEATRSLRRLRRQN